jgi:hypothetical protein
MKKVTNYIYLSLALLAATACSKKYDNYPGPDATFSGSVTDTLSNQPLQTEVGGNGIRVKMEELSWSNTPTPYYFYAKQDGTFNNTKIFKGRYRISVEGAFVPLVQYDDAGNVTVDKTRTIDIQGPTKMDFKVEPFLKVEWVGDPVYNSADGTITAKVKFTRGTNNPAFQANITDVYFFINSNPYVGNNNYDNRFSTQVTYNGADGNDQIGQTITITSSGGKMPDKRTYYLRVGARVDYGLKFYNYTEVKSVAAP